MGSAAQVPTSFGQELRACLRCRLVKTYDQFREIGCENCPFFNMDKDHERVVDCTTPNFNGRLLDYTITFDAIAKDFLIQRIQVLHHKLKKPDNFSNGPKQKLGGPLVENWFSLTGKFVPGCYTLAVSEQLPEEMQAVCEDNNVPYVPPKRT